MAYKANHNNTIDSLYEDHRKAPPTPPSPPATLGRQIASPSHLNSNASSIGNANHATATAPIPEDDSGIPWGDRKPAASKTFTFSDYEYEADYDSNEFECEADYEAEYEYEYKYKYEYQMEDIDTDDDDPSLMDPKRFRNNGVTDNTISPDVESGIIVASDPVVRQALVGKKDGVLFPRTSFSSPQRSRSFRRSDSSLSPIITSDPPGDASTTLHGTIQTTTTSTNTTAISTTTSTTSTSTTSNTNTNTTNTNTNTTAKEEAAATPKLLQDEQDNDDSSTLLIDSAKQLFPPPRFHDTSTSSTYYNKKKKNTGIITKRELLWAVLIFFAIVGIAVGATTAVLFVGDRQGIGSASASSSNMVGLPPTTTTLAPIPGDHSDPSSNPPKLTVREEWELVCAAIRSSPATRSLLVVGNGNGNNNNNNNNNNEDDTLLSDDPSVYRELVQGMVFSEQHRDWIPSAFGPGSDDDQDDLINLHGMMTATGALATANANANATATATATATANNANQNYGSNLLERPPPLTPHQKATAWLLYYDTRKDPNESVWRWALAALYFRMGGPGWTIFSSADDDVEDDYNEYGHGHGRASSSSKATTPRWFTSAPICDWERLGGCQALQSHPQYHQYDLHKHQHKHKHQQHQQHKQPPPRLPVDLDFDDANLSGSIPPEFALLKLYYYPAATNGTNNETDTDTDTDTGLSSESSSSSMASSSMASSSMASSSMASSTVVRTITLTDNQLTGKIPGPVFAELAPSLGKLYLDGNQLTGSIPIELGGLDALYVQNNALTGDWPEEFCADNGTDSAIDNNIGNPIHAKSTVVDDYGLDCDQVECSCCGIMQCYY